MKSLFTTILLLSVLLSVAQPPGMGKNDPEAKKVLDAVSNKFKSFKTVTAKFNLKVENAAGKVQGSKSGTLYMKGTKYRVSVTGQEIFCDGHNVWTYDKGNNEVQVTQFDASAATITPQKLFTNFYDKDFLYKLNGESKVGGKVIQEIELTPIDKTKPFYKVLVSINKAGQTITQTKVFEQNGNKYTYSIASMQTNAAVAENQFVFDQKNYKGVEVVDLR